MSLFGIALASGLLAGWLRRGSFAALGRATLRWAWLIPVALLLELYVAFGIGLDVPWWVAPLHLASFAMLLGVVARNRGVPGMPILALGLFLNALVVVANGGLMPESPETLHVKHAGQNIAVGQHPPQTKDIVLPRDQTRFWWLGDVLATPPGFPVQTVVSLGDVLVAVGLAVAAAGLMQIRPLGQARQMAPVATLG